MGNARWGSEDNPAVDSDGFVALFFLDADVSSKEQQGKRGHFSAVVQEDLKGDGGIANTQLYRYYNTLPGLVTES